MCRKKQALRRAKQVCRKSQGFFFNKGNVSGELHLTLHAPAEVRATKEMWHAG